MHRLLTLGLVLALAGLHWVGPVFAAPAHSCCCKGCQGDCACCRRVAAAKSAGTPALSSRPSCPDRCGCRQPGVSPQALAVLPPEAIPQPAAGARAAEVPREQAPAATSSFLACLYDRPPPASL